MVAPGKGRSTASSLLPATAYIATFPNVEKSFQYHFAEIGPTNAERGETAVLGGAVRPQCCTLLVNVDIATSSSCSSLSEVGKNLLFSSQKKIHG